MHAIALAVSFIRSDINVQRAERSDNGRAQIPERLRRVLRLIVNLVPTNALQRAYGGAAKRMGYPGLWPLMTIFDDQV